MRDLGFLILVAVWTLAPCAWTGCKGPTPHRDAGPSALAASDAGAPALDAASRAAQYAAMDSYATLRSRPSALLEGLSDVDAKVREAALGAVERFVASEGAFERPVLDALSLRVAGEAEPKLRAKVVRVFGRLPQRDVVPALVSRLPMEKDEGVRAALFEVFARKADRRALAVLTPLLAEKMPPRGVLEAVGRIGDPSVVPALAPLLAHASGGIRSEAVEVLGAIGGDAVAAAVGRALTDADSGVVREAIRSASRAGSAALVRPLLALVGAPDKALRARAVRALGAFAKPELLPVPLVTALLRKRVASDELDVQVEAARALGRLREGRKAPLELLAAAHTTADAKLRAAALEALGAFTDPTSSAPLATALGEPNVVLRRVAAAAASALGAAASPALRALVARRLSTETDEETRAALVRAAGRCGDPASAAPLFAATERDTSAKVRAASAVALLKLGDVRGLRMLRPELIEASDVKVRRLAARALDPAIDLGAFASLLSEAMQKERDPSVALKLYDVVAKMKGEAARALQRKALGVRAPNLRVRAAAGLCQNAEPSGCGVLAELLGAADHEARLYAIAAGAPADARWLAALRKAAQDEVPAVAKAALAALSRSPRP